MIKLFSVVLTMSFLNTTFAAPPKPQTFEYRVRIPESNLTCAEEAEALQSRFISATKIPNAKATCEGIIDATFDKGLVHLYLLNLSMSFTHSENEKYFIGNSCPVT